MGQPFRFLADERGLDRDLFAIGPLAAGIENAGAVPIEDRRAASLAADAELADAPQATAMGNAAVANADVATAAKSVTGTATDTMTAWSFLPMPMTTSCSAAALIAARRPSKSCCQRRRTTHRNLNFLWSMGIAGVIVALTAGTMALTDQIYMRPRLSDTVAGPSSC